MNTANSTNTLTTKPVAPLLDRLFEEAAANEPAAISAARGAVPLQEWTRMRHSKTEYPAYYARLKDAPLSVSRETGRLLYMLARSCNAQSIVEFGTSFGISTLYLASALRDNGGGRLITTELEPSKVARAKDHLSAAGLSDLVDFRQGDGLKTLSVDLPDKIDLVLLDGAKSLYPAILDLLESRLRPGALIVGDNADHSPDYLARVRDPANGYLSTPFGEEVELSMRTV